MSEQQLQRQQQLQQQQEQQQLLRDFLSGGGGLSQPDGGGGGGGDAFSGVPSAAALGYEAMAMPQRRLSSLGLGGFDRRASGLLVDDLFGGRRASIGLDMGMEGLFNRRDSMDSTAAALEGVLRRYSMLGGGGGATAPAGGSIADLGLPLNVNVGGGAGLVPGLFASQQAPHQSDLAIVGGNSLLEAHHERLLRQQRELEMRQKQLEEQRRLLLTSMGHNLGMGMSNFLQNQNLSPFELQMQQAQLRESLGLGTLGRNSLGLGSMSRGSLGLGAGFNASSQLPTSSMKAQQWFVCSICNSQAFNSKEEHDMHERMCLLSRGGGKPQNQTSAKESIAAKATTAAPTYVPGPYFDMKHPVPLGLESDKDWLTPLHCFIRRYCVEVFTATEQDVATPSKGKRKPITVGQVGIRCPHCHHPGAAANGPQTDSIEAPERGSIYYPTCLSSIYNAAMNLLQRHLHACPHVPDQIREQYDMLKQDDARSGTSKQYWINSAKILGLVDTQTGIRYKPHDTNKLPMGKQRAPSLSNSNDLFSSVSNAASDMLNSEGILRGDNGLSSPGAVYEASSATGAGTMGSSFGNATNNMEPSMSFSPNVGASPGMMINKSEREMAMTTPLVFPEDKPYATAFSYHLLSQMQPCVFTEADRLGKRKGLPPGFPGLACRHCFGGFGSGRFFPSSIKTLSDTSKTLNVLHNHMLRCRKCPAEIREVLETFRLTHNDERSKMKFGSQKAFFGRIWRRLHGKSAGDSPKRNKRPHDDSDSADVSAESHSDPPLDADASAPPVAEPSAHLDDEPALKKQKGDDSTEVC